MHNSVRPALLPGQSEALGDSEFITVLSPLEGFAEAAKSPPLYP